MDARQLELVVAITDEGTFTAAAQRLHVAQPAVSHQVKVLERQLGFPLFRRTARGAVPTPQCQALLPSARTALAALDDARAAWSRAGEIGSGGRVRLGAALGVDRATLVRLLSLHAGEQPAIGVSVVRDGSQRLMDLLAAREIDLAVLATSAERLAPGLRAQWLPPAEVVCVTPAAHPLALAGHAELAVVLTERLVSLPRSAGLRESLERAALAVGTDLVISYEANDLDLVIDLVCAGLGVALLPRTAVAHRDDIGVVRLDSSPLSHRTAIVWPARTRPRPPVERLRELLLATLT